jgi:2-phospho-L-lactate guanylyltransferase
MDSLKSRCCLIQYAYQTGKELKPRQCSGNTGFTGLARSRNVAAHVGRRVSNLPPARVVHMNAVLIPVRSTTGSKNRLAADFDEDARTRLTLAMLADMVAAAHRARTVDVVYVVSSDTALLERARCLGASTLVETPQAPPVDARRTSLRGLDRDEHGGEVRGGLNRAVFHAARTLAARGIARLLTIPGDVPLVTAAEVDEVFAAAAEAPVVLVPSAAGTGTNGLLTTPPTVIAPHFEGESLAAHVRACDAASIAHALRPAAGFALDIDTVDDLRVLARAETDRESVRVAAALLARYASEAPRACAAGSRG